MIFECMLRLRVFFCKFLMYFLICLKIKIKIGLEILFFLIKINDDGVYNRLCFIDWDENILINVSVIIGVLLIKVY